MASTARRIATRAPDPFPLLRVLAVALVLAAPVGVHAQSRDTDAELKALIPDSALRDADAWALDTDAARTGAPDPAIFDQFDADIAMPELPGMTIAWPEGSDLPAITPLTPDPDIDVAEQATEAAVGALPGAEENGNGQMADAEPREIERIGKQVELAFPVGADAVPERGAIASRFAALSSLKSFDDDDDNLAQIVRRGRTDAETLREILRVHGYYDAQITQTLGGLRETPAAVPVAQAVDNTAQGADAASATVVTPATPPRRTRGAIDVESVVVRFDIQPGPQYRFGTLTFGDLASTGPDYEKLRGAFALNPGDAVNADRIVAERAKLAAALGDSGYAFARVEQPDLLIDHERREGDLAVPVMPGGVYRFGTVHSSLERFLGSRHLGLIARFDPGDTYRRSDVDDLRQAVLATGLVSSVTVETREVQKPADGVPGTVDVDVTLTPGPLRTIAGLVGYSSGEGFRLEAQWEHRNFFPPEGMIRARAVAGTQEQLAGITFRRNNFLKRDLVLNADVYFRNQTSAAFEARTISATAGLERQTTLIFQKPWVFAAGVELLATGERDAAAIRAGQRRKTYFIGALPTRVVYDGSDDLFDPTRGFRIGLRASPELSVLDGNKSTYGKLQFDASAYQRTGENLVLAGRVRLGTIIGTDIANIAPSRRFYAGGGGSVRGYGYQRIGPRDTLGQPSGGRALTEFSLEARVGTSLFDGALSVVPFVDAGAVDTTTSPRLRDLKFGAGVGIRYKTSFGPIRIDIGTPLNRSPGDSPIGVYVALGQAF